MDDKRFVNSIKPLAASLGPSTVIFLTEHICRKFESNLRYPEASLSFMFLSPANQKEFLIFKQTMDSLLHSQSLHPACKVFLESGNRLWLAIIKGDLVVVTYVTAFYHY